MRHARRRLATAPTLAPLLAAAYRLIVPALRRCNAVLRAVCAGSHHLQYKVEGFLRPSAEWFDHEIDVYWQWAARQRSMFLERGVLNTLAIRPGPRYWRSAAATASTPSSTPSAAHTCSPSTTVAKRSPTWCRFHARANIEYRACDILQSIPEGPFDNVIWDSAMHHFTLSEVAVILASDIARWRPAASSPGCTVIEPGEDYAYARLQFQGPEPLADVLAGEFAHVSVLETPDAMRRTLYFFASDVASALPFAEGHPLALAGPAGVAGAHGRQEVLPVGGVGATASSRRSSACQSRRPPSPSAGRSAPTGPRAAR